MDEVHGCKRYQCPLCIKRFTQNGNMMTHIRNIHRDVYKQKKIQEKLERRIYAHECGTCEKRFRKSSQLQSHVKGVHALEYLQCPVCIKRFSRESNLKRHTEITHKPNNFAYEKLCHNGMMQWKFMVDQCIPDDIMQTYDLRHIQLYMIYVKNKAAAYMDDNVDYT